MSTSSTGSARFPHGPTKVTMDAEQRNWTRVLRGPGSPENPGWIWRLRADLQDVLEVSCVAPARFSGVHPGSPCKKTRASVECPVQVVTSLMVAPPLRLISPPFVCRSAGALRPTRHHDDLRGGALRCERAPPSCEKGCPFAPPTPCLERSIPKFGMLRLSHNFEPPPRARALCILYI